MNDLIFVATLLVLILLAFVGMWYAICYLVSAIGGWRRLAQCFAATEEPFGRCFSGQSGKVGSANYNYCLTIYAAEKGFYLSVWPIFRGHPTLFIPWYEVHNARSFRLGWFDGVAFDVGPSIVTTLQLPKSIFEGHNVVT